MTARLAFALLLFCLAFVPAQATAQANVPETTEKTTSAADETASEERLSLPPVGEGDAEDEIRRAKNLYDYGNHQKVVERLERALDLQMFTKTDQKQEALALIGVSSLILGDESRAGRVFLDLLRLDPDFRLNPVLYPPAIIDFVERIREENQEELQAILMKNGQEEPVEPEEPPPAVQIVEKHPYYINFIPFGAGQFQNDQDAKGALFLSAEIVTLGVNVTSFFVARSLEGSDGKYSASNARQARDWTIAQYSALGAFVLLAVGGVIDAALNWKPEVTLEPSVQTETTAKSSVSTSPILQFDATGASIRF